MSQQLAIKKKSGLQVRKHVCALPMITTGFGLRCGSEGAVSCLQSYYIWTLLNRQTTFMGKILTKEQLTPEAPIRP